MSKFEELMANEEFMKELSQKETKEDVIALFAQNSIEMNDEDYNGLKELISGAIQPEGEISETELDSVSGGAWYKYKCTCGDKFRSEWFAHFHAVRKNAKNIFCGDGGFKFCTADGEEHFVKSID